jgi:lysine 2,3-aminomutase
MLKMYQPLWISLHCTHPDEITAEMSSACEKLANAGFPLGSQTVLLSGINDNAVVMHQLMRGLVKNRVRPYYLYQCDPIIGSSHFRTPCAKGPMIISEVREFMGDWALPTYVIDAPGGGGKIPVDSAAMLHKLQKA